MKPSASICVLATGKHYEYIPHLVASIAKFLMPDCFKDIYVVTDAAPRADTFINANTILHIRPSKPYIPNIPVYLYEMFFPYREEICRNPFAIKIDADMLVVEYISAEEFLPNENEDFVITQYFLADIKARKLEHYNMPPFSLAYMPLDQLNTPAWQGCIYGGRSQQFFEMGEHILPQMKHDIANKAFFSAWEEAYICKYLNDKRVKTLPCNYATPLRWHEFTDDIKPFYENLCNHQKPKIFHYNHTTDKHTLIEFDPIEEEKILLRGAGNYTDGLKEFATWLPKDIVMAEIGSYLGESSKIFLDSGAVRTIFCIDPWLNNFDPKDAAYQKNMGAVEKYFDQRMTPYKNYIKVKQKAENVVDMFPNESLDLVYVDAIHTYEETKKNIELYLPKIKKGGILAGHDIVVPDVLRAVVDTVGQPYAAFIDTTWMTYIR